MGPANEAINLELTVNFVSFGLREPVAPSKFTQASIKKLGIVGKALALAPPWAPLYSARGPEFSCFGSKPRRFIVIDEPALSVFFHCWRGSIQVITAVALSRQGRNVDVLVNWFAQLAGEYLGQPTLETDRLWLWRQADQELIAGKRDLFLRWTHGPWRTNLSAKEKPSL
jgi:hypothetical protein